VKITILGHNLSSNASMRAHRLAMAAKQFAEVTVVGPVKQRGAWGPLPQEPWIKPIEIKNVPKFYRTAIELISASEGDVLIAVKPYLPSFGVALLAAECRSVPVILDLDDLDSALFPEPNPEWKSRMAELRDPLSLVYLGLLTKLTAAASGITVASSRLQKRFGGTLVPHGCPVSQFTPSAVNREKARKRYGFVGPVVLFPGTRRTHKGLRSLAKAVAHVQGARLAVLCRPGDYSESKWDEFPLTRIPTVPYEDLPELLAAADVIAIPQLDTEAAQHQMPMKVYDAMAMAKPIVATSVSDLPVVLDGCARIVTPGNSEELANSIKDLLENPAKATALGERARARCLEKYSMERVGEALLAAINDAKARFGAGH
jgi:glycosyltransferase involved in cell wall biosynthesis